MKLHEPCGKTHRTEEAAEKCSARLARRKAAQEKKEADIERRRANEAKESVVSYVFRRRREGATLDKVAAELNRDYPVPTPDELGVFAFRGKYTWEVVLDKESSRLNW